MYVCSGLSILCVMQLSAYVCMHVCSRMHLCRHQPASRSLDTSPSFYLRPQSTTVQVSVEMEHAFSPKPAQTNISF